MMLNSGMIRRDPEDVLDLYFKQCSVRVTCSDLAIMGATLANNGVNPVTEDKVIGPEHVRDVLTLMNSCGMYNYAGQWAYEVGIPAKSGVSGGIVAVIPGQIGIGVYSPRLDPHGNSIRGVRVCKEISEEFGLHVFNSHTSVGSVIRREYRGNTVHSKRLRTPGEWSVLAKDGARIAVLELQGTLFFGSVERLIRRVSSLAEEADFLVIDFKRVQLADAAAIKLIQHLAEAVGSLHCRIGMTHLEANRSLAGLRKEIAKVSEHTGVILFGDTDDALERFEDAILEESPDHRDRTKFALSQLDIFNGLSPAECRLLEDIVQPLHFEKGDAIIREGDAAGLFFVVARGSVSVYLPVDGERSKRIACIGPGLSFGEMALLDGGRRSADVIADESVICYGLSVDRLRELAADHPNIMITILGNLTRDFSARLRRANDEIKTLE
jgi:glutaminase